MISIRATVTASSPRNGFFELNQRIRRFPSVAMGGRQLIVRLPGAGSVVVTSEENALEFDAIASSLADAPSVVAALEDLISDAGRDTLSIRWSELPHVPVALR